MTNDPHRGASVAHGGKGASMAGSLTSSKSAFRSSTSRMMNSQVYRSTTSTSRIKKDASRVGYGGPRGRQIVVKDETGQDVTPLPLVPRQTAPQAGKPLGESRTAVTMIQSASDIFGMNQLDGPKGLLHVPDSARGSVTDFLNHLENSAGATSSTNFQKAFSMSNLHASLNASRRIREEEDDFSETSDEENAADEFNAFSYAPPSPSKMTRKEAEAEPFLSVHLNVTEYIPLFSMPSLTVTADTQEALALEKANARYALLLQNGWQGIEKSCQTMAPGFPKHKETQCVAQQRKAVDTQVNVWSIHDAFEADAQQKALELADGTLAKHTGVGTDDVTSPADERFDHSKSLTAAVMSTGSQSTMAGSASLSALNTGAQSLARLPTGSMTASPSAIMEGGALDSIASLQASRRNSTSNLNHDDGALLLRLDQESLMNSLRIMEQTLLGTTYHQELCAYQGIPVIQEKLDVPTHREAQRLIFLLFAFRLQEKNSIARVATETAVVSAVPSAFPHLHLLWSFRCELTRNRNVNAIAFNRTNSQIIAVAYGAINKKLNANPHDGLVLCWSVTNPEYPDRIYYTDSPVMSLDFATAMPNLLAGGLMDGRIKIWDVRENATSIADTGTLPSRHNDAVWDVKWIQKSSHDQETAPTEVLISTCADGKVTQWLAQKNCESTDLMTLKRISKETAGSPTKSQKEKNRGLLTPNTPGLSVDFHKADQGLYLVGSEDGTIFRCSTSYTEQPTDFYAGHSGPVYKIAWSPFSDTTFLSCSSDWTVRIWDTDPQAIRAAAAGSSDMDGETKTTANKSATEAAPTVKTSSTAAIVDKHQMVCLSSAKSAISDVAWSPLSSTILGSVSASGKVELWDLTSSTLDPLISHPVLDRRLSKIAFAPSERILLTGDDYGVVSVYHINNVPFASPEEGIINTETQRQALKTWMSHAESQN